MSKQVGKTGARQVSVVVPVFNEEGNVAELHREIDEVCRAQGYEYEIIFVDDGSRDATWERMQGLAPLVGLRLRRNFGQTSAMDAGIKQAQFPYIITMDGDRQNDPADIPRLIEALEEKGVDIVSGWRRKRKDGFTKRFVSLGARFIRRFLLNDGIHDSGCSLKIYRQECFEGITLYGEMHRFIPAILRIKGFRIGEIEVNHRPRVSGRTKYNWRRSVKGFLDMFSVWFWNKFAVRPLHLLGGVGILCLLAGFAVTVWGLALYILGSRFLRNVLPLTAVFLYLNGMQMFVFGLMADMLAKSYFAASDDAPYQVAQVIKQDRA
ncbi:MAG: glycosyltransferase [Spirochaetaceae bacterium]|nr:MAG: glycosyltransferase [Spirochaetaceae bacterium]